MDDVAVSAGVPMPEEKPEQSTLKRKLMIAAWVIAAVAVVMPVWMVEYPPLLDYPKHMARAFVLHEMHNPAFQFDQWMASDWGPYPYLGMDATMAVLLR